LQRRSRKNTKVALIHAAERLFAERGLGAVSVRDITRMAGARNESALHYHFGGMEALVREVFASRYRDIEQSRVAHLARIDSAGSDHDVIALMEAAMGPLLETCLDEGGRLYARFAIQLVTNPRFDVVELVSDLEMDSVLALTERLLVCLDHLPEGIVETRLRRVFTLSVALMADYARLVEKGDAPPVEEATREAATSLAGFLLAE